ncbi:MAG: hypothetical protein ACO1RT_00870 [Planctomycetaceae bacterium]
MSERSGKRELVWMICEAGDRWYAAVCRFAPERMDREQRLRVERFGPDSAALVAAATRHATVPVVVLWELPVGEPAELVSRLDGIVAVRSEVKHAFQMASLPTTATPEHFLAAREAGIAVFLQSPESLQQLREIVAQQLSPLG